MLDYPAMGRKIRQARKKRGMTQEDLAEQCKISASFLGHIERGSRVASLETLVHICNVLHTSPSYFLENELDSFRPPMPPDMSPEDYIKVCAILRFALETIRG